MHYWCCCFCSLIAALMWWWQRVFCVNLILAHVGCHGCIQVAPQQQPMTQQPMSVNLETMVIPQSMTVGQPGMTVGQHGMVQPGMPVPQAQIPPGQTGMPQGFVPGAGVGVGTVSLPSSTVPAQSPLDIFVGTSSTDTSGLQQSATQQELRQQRTIWSGQYLVNLLESNATSNSMKPAHTLSHCTKCNSPPING